MTRVAIVTGGTRGIGEAISLALRDMGITVAANYAGNSERAEAFTRRTGIRNYKWDVGDFYACEAFCAQIAEDRSEEHTSELQSLMRISYAVLCLKKKNTHKR